AVGVDCFLGSAQRVGNRGRALLVVPRAMIAPDRVMMRDSPAIRNHGVERCTFDCVPLRAELSRLAERVEREIEGGPVRIDMREAAGDRALSGRPLTNCISGRSPCRLRALFQT